MVFACAEMSRYEPPASFAALHSRPPFALLRYAKRGGIRGLPRWAGLKPAPTFACAGIECRIVGVMKITNVKMSVLEMDGADRYFDLIKLEGQRRERWLHHTVPARSKTRYEYVLHVETDEGVVGVCTTPGDGHTGLHPGDVPQLQALVVGEDPLKREYLYQKLHQGNAVGVSVAELVRGFRQLSLGYRG